MKHGVSKERKNKDLEEWINSNFKEIRENYGGKFIAILESGDILVKDQYLELLKELEKRDIDSGSITITNVPTDKK